AVVGKEKSRKTFCITAMVSALLSGKRVLNFTPSIPSDRKKIIYVDTEQGIHHCQKVVRRVRELTGWNKEQIKSRLAFLVLRKYDTKSRIRLIEEAIYDNPDAFVLCIDGLRDLLFDINSPLESTNIMSKLLRWSEELNIHIISVVHLNKGDSNVRGHLGTELNNKSESIIQVAVSENDKSISIVSPKAVRDKAFEDFSFYINEEGLPESISLNNHNTFQKIDWTSLSDDQHLKVLQEAFGMQRGFGYEELQRELKSAYLNVLGLSYGNTKVVNIIKHLRAVGLIIQEGKLNILNPKIR
ncbi:MAG: AAA family ATPase, partial [Bacteroidales bacterium]